MTPKHTVVRLPGDRRGSGANPDIFSNDNSIKYKTSKYWWLRKILLYYALLTLLEFPSCWNCCWKIPLFLRWKPLEVELTAGAIALRTPLASRSKLGFQTVTSWTVVTW
jgi:hypothetical protein